MVIRLSTRECNKELFSCMSTSIEFITYIRECIADPRARLHPMFGEYALYYDEKVVALICDGTIFLKITPGTTKILEDAAT